MTLTPRKVSGLAKELGEETGWLLRGCLLGRCALAFLILGNSTHDLIHVLAATSPGGFATVLA